MVVGAGTPEKVATDPVTNPEPATSTVKLWSVEEIAAAEEMAGIGLRMFTVTDEATELDSVLVQAMTTVPAAIGAVKVPFSEIVPTLEFPPGTPFTDQVTEVFFMPADTAEKDAVPPARTSLGPDIEIVE